MIYLVRFSEIFLKGKNKKEFEKKLIKNINYFFGRDIEQIIRLRERIIIYSKKKLDLKRVFGVSSYSEAIETNVDKIKDVLKKELKNKRFETFRISANRIDKDYKKGSMQINKEIGQFVVDSFNKKVSLNECDLDIGIELINKRTYIFFETTNGFGGLPVGIEGSLYALIENENSILAALMMLKRGCMINPVGFKKINIDKLKNYCPKEIHLKTMDKLDINNKVVVVGQTLKDFKELEENIVVRPLIAMDDNEIKKELKKY
jgi:tRNA uracil 4-sulfurtransferase